jgi:hypothetical protein
MTEMREIYALVPQSGTASACKVVRILLHTAGVNSGICKLVMCGRRVSTLREDKRKDRGRASADKWHRSKAHAGGKWPNDERI